VSNELLLRVAFQRAPVALLCIDADGRLRAANDAASELVGLRQDGAAEGPWGAPGLLREMFPGGDETRLRTLCGQALLHRQAQRAELALTSRDGRQRRIRLEASPAADHRVAVVALTELETDGDQAAAIGTSRDGLDRYRRLFAANRDAVLVLDAMSHVIVEANHAAVQLAGRPDLVGLPSADLVAPAHRGTWTMAVTGAAASSSIAPDLEIDLLHERGDLRPIAAQLDGLILGDGRVVVANLRAQAETRPAKRRSRRGKDGTSTGQPLVLVVDDDDGARRAAGRLLRRLGFDTVQAAGGQDAVDLVGDRGRELALVLLDVVMPGVDGLTAYARIKRAHEALPVILCSGYDELDRLEGVSLGTNTRFLPKPFDLDALEQRVRALFRPPADASTAS